ncbi:unnamed protein product, partial [Ectocarpus sp. 6 AP-2014]
MLVTYYRNAHHFRELYGVERCVGQRAALRPSDCSVQLRGSVHWRLWKGPEERRGNYVRRHTGFEFIGTSKKGVKNGSGRLRLPWILGNLA